MPDPVTCDPVPEWLTAIGTLLLATVTLVLAAVAIFQDTVRGWFYHPTLEASIHTQPPDCNAVPVTTLDGTRFLADSIYLRLWIKNTGNASARNVEVYARELLFRRADNTWTRVTTFMPMNLKWSHVSAVLYPIIAPEMGKHCDLGHIVDPARRAEPEIREENPTLKLNDQQTSLAFNVIVQPNDKGFIVGPGTYQLKVLIGAENARPVERTIEIFMSGMWYADETRMLRDEVGVKIIA
jgi:hypothetical protein